MPGVATWSGGGLSQASSPGAAVDGGLRRGCGGNHGFPPLLADRSHRLRSASGVLHQKFGTGTFRSADERGVEWDDGGQGHRPWTTSASFDGAPATTEEPLPASVTRAARCPGRPGHGAGTVATTRTAR